MKTISLFAAMLLPFCSMHATDRDVPKLTLSASATILKPSDELQLKIGVVTLGKTANEALSENSDKMQNIIANLGMIDITSDDYETSNFSIHPTYTPRPKDPPEDWQPSINGYEVTNTLLIHTPKLNMAGKIIDTANQAGANNISDIRFGLHNSREYWTEALSAAGMNAVQDAQAIANATGVRLARVLSISLNNTQVHSPQINFMAMAKCSAPSTPIEPGDVSITANVTLIYEIE